MDELVKWLMGVLDAAERREHERYSDDDGYLYEPNESVLARVLAERAIVDEHADQHECTDGIASTQRPPEPCKTLRLLAYGHRYDADGYDPMWAPEGVTASGG